MAVHEPGGQDEAMDLAVLEPMDSVQLLNYTLKPFGPLDLV